YLFSQFAEGRLERGFVVGGELGNGISHHFVRVQDNRGRCSKRYKDDGEDNYSQHEAALVRDGVYDGIFVELAARSHQPKTAYPKQKDRNEEPESLCVTVEMCGIEVRNIERKNRNRDVA